MRRREFITLFGSAAAAWPIATRAEQPARLPTIGFLGLFTPTDEWVAAFVQRLSELRWVVGNTVAIEYRSAEGRNDRLAEFAAEFVRLKVDAIVTLGTPSVLAMMQATSVISIVFVAVGDPVANASASKMSSGQKPKQNRARHSSNCDHIDKVLLSHRHYRCYIGRHRARI